MSSVPWSNPLAIALVGGVGSLILWLLNCAYANWRNRQDRRREIFSKAFAACVAYQEFPYIVRRRRSDQPESERIRISSELSLVQRELAYHTALLSVESSRVSEAYGAVLVTMRKVAGEQIHNAWLSEPVANDSGMNMPNLGLQALEPAKAVYLQEMHDALSLVPSWLLRWCRGVRPRR